jgi:uncharacterized phage-associated protein
MDTNKADSYMTQHGAKGQQPDARKMEELILYLASLSEFDPHFGATKLNKLLFYCDFTAYSRFGKSMTGYDYQRWDHGPRPKELDKLMAEMHQKKSLATEFRQRFDYPQHRSYALRDADLSLFTVEELSLIHFVVEKYKDMNARGISEESHGFIGWKLAGTHETIPYSVSKIRTKPELTPTQEHYAKELAKSLTK